MSLLTLQLFLDEGFDSNFYEGLDLARLSVQFLKRQLRDIMRLLRSPLPSLSLQTPPEDPTRRPHPKTPEEASSTRVTLCRGIVVGILGGITSSLET